MFNAKNILKINFEKLFQMIMLALLFFYVTNLINTKSLNQYLHPRMNFLIYSSLYVIILFIFFPLTKISSKGNKSIFKLKYFAFLFLLSLFYFVPKDIIQSDIANLRGVKVGDNTNVYKDNKPDNTFDDDLKKVNILHK